MIKNVRYAGFWIRLIADFIDSTLLDLASCLIGLMALGTLYWLSVGIHRMGGAVPVIFTSSIWDIFSSFGTQIFLVGIRAILSFVYLSWSTFRFGTTLGKKPFGIQVVTDDGNLPISLKQSMIRCLAYWVSYAPLGAGFLMIGFQPEKRGLHDLIAGTVSIIKPKKQKP